MFVEVNWAGLVDLHTVYAYRSSPINVIREVNISGIEIRPARQMTAYQYG
jgi:hypothetical protein